MLSVPEPSPGPEELYSPSDLDHYFLDPEGLNLIDPFVIPQRQSNNDDAYEGDHKLLKGPSSLTWFTITIENSHPSKYSTAVI